MNSGLFGWTSSAFEVKSGKTIVLVLLVMVGSFYCGTFFGRNSSSIYVQDDQFAMNYTSSSTSLGTLFFFVLMDLIIDVKC